MRQWSPSRRYRHPVTLKADALARVFKESREQQKDEGRPISYEALSVGTAVLSSSNTQFGAVEHVLQILELDLFDGVAVKPKHGLRFVDRDQISDITTTLERCPWPAPTCRPCAGGRDEWRALPNGRSRPIGPPRGASVAPEVGARPSSTTGVMLGRVRMPHPRH